MNYDLKAQCGKARAGVFHTQHGSIETPFFFSVGTRAAIKAAVSMDDLKSIGAPALLCNTYHLFLRPGPEIVEQFGGLHKFARWDGPILTDSGGFQVFSLKSKKITDDGVWFRSHINGDKFFLDAKKSIETQHALGSDVIMAFDECPPNVPKWHKIRKAVERTTEWAKQSLDTHFTKYDQKLSPKERPQIFGIIQGGCFEDLRKRSLEELTALPFDGYALGGLAVGETEQEMYTTLDQVTQDMPADKPRYLMGVGTPTNLLQAIKRGIDMFDCVMPMRNARHGTVFTSEGTLKISNAQYAEDHLPIDPQCPWDLGESKNYTRGYLHHLIRTGEDLGKRLLTLHNLAFYHGLLHEARTHIRAGDYDQWADEWIKKWKKFDKVKITPKILRH